VDNHYDVVECYMFLADGRGHCLDKDRPAANGFFAPTPRTPWSTTVATVHIPTILRTYTGGEKSVEAKGATVAEVIDDLDSRYGGLRDRLTTNGSLYRFVNIYVDDEDVRFAGGLDAPVKDGSTVTILPGVATEEVRTSRVIV
jgi:molybdopterin converting factor small subunit